VAHLEKEKYKCGTLSSNFDRPTKPELMQVQLLYLHTKNTFLKSDNSVETALESSLPTFFPRRPLDTVHVARTIIVITCPYHAFTVIGTELCAATLLEWQIVREENDRFVFVSSVEDLEEEMGTESRTRDGRVDASVVRLTIGVDESPTVDVLVSVLRRQGCAYQLTLSGSSRQSSFDRA
jgi:hypothetical protein